MFLLRTKILPALLLLYTFLISCESGKSKMEFSEIFMQRKVSRPSDSSFFNMVFDVVYDNHELVITDISNNRVLRCDSSFKIIKSYGRAGDGPGEFKGAMRSYLKKNFLFTFDEGNRLLLVFTSDGKFLKGIRYPNDIFTLYRFVVDDSLKLYVSYTKLGASIIKLDTAGNELIKFGSVFAGKSIGEQNSRSYKHILISGNGNLVCVSVSEPVIEIYTRMGKKVQEFDLSDVPYIKKRLQYAENEYRKDAENRESTYMLFHDAYLINDHLYLLCVDIDNLDRIVCDKILQYKIGPTDIKLIKALDLGDGKNTLSYKTFAVSNDEKTIYAYVSGLAEWRIFSVP